MNIFLQAATISEGLAGSENFGVFFAFIIAFLIFFIILAIALYIYTSLAFMAIARKTRTEPAGMAWIPAVGPAIIASKAAKMHWWPILLMIGFFIPLLNFIFIIAFMVFFTIWQWKMFEALNKPGWWAILCLLSPLNFIFWGIAAWSKK